MSEGANDLLEFFENGEHRLVHKWMHYFEIYDRHFRRFRGRSPRVLEFGVFHGGSLQMWKQYFGEGAQIYGVDIDPRTAALAEEGVNILIGDQQDRAFLRSLERAAPAFDIVIDDGGHTMQQQITTFEEMFPRLAEGGVYLAEDLMTSYWPPYGGGLRQPGSFIEYAKQLIDRLHAWYVQDPSLPVDAITRWAYSLNFYNGVIVIEKRAMDAPTHRMKGSPSFALNEAERAVYDNS